jgi:hypothetical protein
MLLTTLAPNIGGQCPAVHNRRQVAGNADHYHRNAFRNVSAIAAER